MPRDSMGHLDRTAFQDMLRDIHISNVFQREAPSLIRLLLVNDMKGHHRRCRDKIDTQRLYALLGGVNRKEEGDKKLQNDAKQFSNALLLHIDKHCRQKGKRVVDVFRLVIDTRGIFIHAHAATHYSVFRLTFCLHPPIVLFSYFRPNNNTSLT
jgi:hypothetical protein